VPNEDCINDKPTSIVQSGYLMSNCLLQNLKALRKFLKLLLVSKERLRPTVVHRYW